jgi:peptide/nickel transport system substrate-binding protein
MQPENIGPIFSDPHTANSKYADRAFSAYDPYVHYYWINTKIVPNRDIRAAMLVALDREALRENSGGDYVGDFADGVIKPSIGQDYAPTGLWDTVFGQPIPDNGDPDLARTLISQAGVKPPTLNWYYFASPAADMNADTIKQSLETIGFKVKLHSLDPRACSYSGSCNFPDQALGSAGWGADWPNASTVIPSIFTNQGPWNKSKVDDSSGIPDWTAQVNDALTTTDRTAQALKWQTLNKDAVEQAWIIPLFFSLSQNIAGTNVGGVYRWTPYSSWPYAQLYAKSTG